MKKPAKYFVNYDPIKDAYCIKKSCYYSKNNWNYYQMGRNVYSPKANLVFDSLEEAEESLKTASKAVIRFIGE